MAYTTNFGMVRNNSAPAASSAGMDYLTKLGYGDLLGTAKSNTKNLLSGLPSTDMTRTANAYFGAQSGLGGGSDFLRNRGYDLYNQQAEGRNQQGLQNLLALIGGTSQPELANQGQQFQNQQFGASLGENARQFNQDLELRNFLAQLQAIGLGNTVVNSGKNALPTFNF